MSAHIFGLDIGRAFIKVAQVNVNGGRRILTAAGSIATVGNGVNADTKQDQKNLAEAIKKCINSSKINGNHCAVSIVESQAVTRLIQLPNLTDKELTAAINFEADQYIPLPIKEVNIQYKVVSRPQPGSGGKMDVMLVAASKIIVQKYLEIIKTTGLKLKAIETESSALARSLSNISDPPSIIVSMGANSTEIVMVKGGNVFFTRSISTGGNALTKAIVTEFKLNQNQAEQYKMAYGIAEDKLSGKIANVMKPILEILINEILKAIDFTRTRINDEQISRIIICGGGSYLPGLTEYITQKTSIEVSNADPWAGFSKEGLILKIPGQGSYYSVATGLALRT